MIDTDLNPHLLEVTFSPNTQNVLSTNNNFLNEVFRCLYLGEEEKVVRIL